MRFSGYLAATFLTVGMLLSAPSVDARFGGEPVLPAHFRLVAQSLALRTVEIIIDRDSVGTSFTMTYATMDGPAHAAREESKQTFPTEVASELFRPLRERAGPFEKWDVGANCEGDEHWRVEWETQSKEICAGSPAQAALARFQSAVALVLRD